MAVGSQAGGAPGVSVGWGVWTCPSGTLVVPGRRALCWQLGGDVESGFTTGRPRDTDEVCRVTEVLPAHASHTGGPAHPLQPESHFLSLPTCRLHVPLTVWLSPR